MSQSTILALLPQTTFVSPQSDVVGNTTPAAAYYLGNQNLQTISYKFDSVTANLIIEGTLATTPGDADWFKLHEVIANNQQNVNSNINSFTNLTGNFTYMRARLDDFDNGVVQFVKISY